MTGNATKRKEPRVSPWIRRGVQLFFLVLVAFIATTATLAEKGVSLPLSGDASLHAICPFGGVVTFYQLVGDGTIVKKLHESSVVLAAVGIVLAILAGPLICGWVCPFGSVQEWFASVGRKLFKRRYNHFVPRRLDRIMRYLRYLVLAWVLYVTAMSGKLFFDAYDPYYALFHFWTGEVAPSALVILGLVAVASLFVERPFCKYACPYGAFLGIFNLFRIFGVKRNAATCISCAACDRACPMNIEVSKSGVVRNHQCISCLKCTSEAACPVPETVVLAAGRPGREATGPGASEAPAGGEG